MEDNSWLWQGTTTEIIDIVVAALGATLLGWLKRRNYLWTEPVRYGLSGFVLLVFAFAGIKLFLRPEPPAPAEPTTAENIQERIRLWIDAFHLSSQAEDDEKALFLRILTMPNGNRIRVTRTRERDRYLMFQVVLRPQSQAEQNTWAKLTPAQLEEAVREITVEVTRTRTQFVMRQQPFGMVLERRVPITDGLTEAAFIQHVDDMDAVALLVQSVTGGLLRKFGVVR